MTQMRFVGSHSAFGDRIVKIKRGIVALEQPRGNPHFARTNRIQKIRRPVHCPKCRETAIEERLQRIETGFLRRCPHHRDGSDDQGRVCNAVQCKADID